MGGVVQEHAEINDDSKQPNAGHKGSVSVSDKINKGSLVQLIRHKSNVSAAGRIDLPANLKITNVQVLVTGYTAVIPDDIRGMFVVNETPANAAILFNAGVYPDSGNTGEWPVYIAPIDQLVDSVDVSAKSTSEFITSIDYSPVRGASVSGTALNFMFILRKEA